MISRNRLLLSGLLLLTMTGSAQSNVLYAGPVAFNTTPVPVICSFLNAGSKSVGATIEIVNPTTDTVLAMGSGEVLAGRGVRVFDIVDMSLVVCRFDVPRGGKSIRGTMTVLDPATDTPSLVFKAK